MPEPATLPRLVRFGIYEVDLRSGELRKNGQKIKIQEQPFHVLAMLLEHPGEIVTREELQRALWSTDTFVDFEHGLNKAINKIREALGDSADNPRFVETLARRGYRFIYPVAPVSPPAADVGAPLQKRWVKVAAGATAAVVATLAVLLALNVADLRDRLLRRAAPVPKIESIAVLPLENLSGDKEQEYFADGMTEELITNLGKVSALRVISRQSMMRYKGSKKPLPEIAKELNVDALVEGTVQRSGDRVRITANLLHAPSDRHLWAESYERDLRDVLALQGEVARAIANEVRIKVTPQEEARLARARPVNTEAYEAYLMARFNDQRSESSTVKKALEYIHKAVELDPGYAPSQALLAHIYGTHGSTMLGLTPKESAAKARAAADKALSLDPTLAEAHVDLATIKVLYERDWVGAGQGYKHALELNPNSARIYPAYVWYLSLMGQYSEAIQEAERGSKIDPLNPNMSTEKGFALYRARQYDEALDQFKRALELDPSFASAHLGLNRVYLQKGMYREAIAKLEERAWFGGGPNPLQGYVYGVVGRRAEAREVLQKLMQLSKKQYVPPTSLALVCLGLGDKDEALVWLEKGYHDRDGDLVSINVDPKWDPLRSDPRFQDLLRRMNFPP